MSPSLSCRLKATRDAFKSHVHGGKTFSADEIIALIWQLDELIVMSKELERDLARHQSMETHRLDQLIGRAGNVIVLQPRPVRRPPPPGGGDAA
ncbi:hypothetical protein DFR52_106256 [Hoeflea marina]|uniref:Uncharacterized protein n=1 Tax=Hoeflea marina TaxID=274592 RepID=A0A317PGE9_9HYPH|nr:hypothetical protein [Hoeflea marina]PWV97731.1 hypothetical protein DFR52_106256 [Hoeflea marina]